MALSYLLVEDKLTGEYKTAYGRVKLYADMHNYGEEVLNEKMMDLLDLLLQAQEEQQPWQSVLGKDIDQFSKDFFSITVKRTE